MCQKTRTEKNQRTKGPENNPKGTSKANCRQSHKAWESSPSEPTCQKTSTPEEEGGWWAQEPPGPEPVTRPREALLHSAATCLVHQGTPSPPSKADSPGSHHNSGDILKGCVPPGGSLKGLGQGSISPSLGENTPPHPLPPAQHNYLSY